MGGSGGSNRMKQVMAGAASLLGMGGDALRTAMGSGQATLADLAAQKGVSRDDLLVAVAKGLQDAGPPPGAESIDAAAIAERITDGTGGPPRAPGGPGGPRDRDGDHDGDMATRLQSLTSALDMDQTSFFDALKSGRSLAQLADRHGVSPSALHQMLLGPVSVGTSA